MLITRIGTRILQVREQENDMHILRSTMIVGSLCASGVAHADDSRCAVSVDRIQPKSGVVNSEKTAVAVALAYLVPIYGEATIRREMPLRASLGGGVWTVSGALPAGSFGGTAQIMICQRNGTVLSIIHYK
ncbi:hypothetical protein HZF05_14700 [Sphingomonas sp. CGMCC 1.13654]|uniref:NTF2 fold domain-containing protein n=1 Tax=Sphingomonas chungangi TaxID=2683589 RepID=A0A838L829_9SPHN|nr:NTF2 fold immunity protein [Sphingomonas chungangi]MBA2935334.1 hypothetical protein [Sphingomonas chungangi]MVW56841.1 hypothetical protein [Sphingomonas chungangi]